MSDDTDLVKRVEQLEEQVRSLTDRLKTEHDLHNTVKLTESHSQDAAAGAHQAHGAVKRMHVTLREVEQEVERGRNLIDGERASDGSD